MNHRFWSEGEWKAAETLKQGEATGKGKKKESADFYVTPDGVVIKNNIPEGLVENPYRNGSYGNINEITGKFQEVLRIDPATPRGMKGPDYSHYHLNGEAVHLSPLSDDLNPLGF